MSDPQVILGPILNPHIDGTVDLFRDGALAFDSAGILTYIGDAQDAPPITKDVQARRADGIVLPPFVDAHTHIPQHPIRGRFMEGVSDHPAGGRLIAGLNRNVFPAEARCADEQFARATVDAFLADTLGHGVVGGSAFMTVHRRATVAALRMLPSAWSVGMVLMNMNCPESLRTDEANVERDLAELAEAFGPRAIITDRFALAVDSSLRRRAMKIAGRYALPAQTHLDEQIAEKAFVEKSLYPSTRSYAHIYEQDGLLDRRAILAHCVWMRDEEIELLSDRRENVAIAHCPTSNALLGSGIMPLDRICDAGLDWALCTDVGASPTQSLLCEMAQFLIVHRGRSRWATPSAAFCRATVHPAAILEIEGSAGTFEIGKCASFIEIKAPPAALASRDVDDVILGGLLDTSTAELDEIAGVECGHALDQLGRAGLDAGADVERLQSVVERFRRRLHAKVSRVTIGGKETWRRRRND